MSNFLTEISRIHELMGIKTPINESLLHNKILLLLYSVRGSRWPNFIDSNLKK
jgi:hypothetical protein